MRTVPAIRRRRGLVSRLHVEIDSNQMVILSACSIKFGKSKKAIVGEALTVWLHLVDPQAKFTNEVLGGR